VKYRKEIDGLRAVAVLPVIFFHAGIGLFSGGFVGVDVFFVISGYLITTIILTEKDAGTFTITGFYERRARRILPALFYVMFACTPFAWSWMTPSQLSNFAESFVSVSLFYSNIWFWADSGYFEIAAELKPLLHTWSLAIEEQYYLFFPIFILALWPFGKKLTVSLLILVSAISLFLAQWGSVNYPAATFYLLPTRVWELLLGSLTAFYLLYRHEKTNTKLPPLAGEALSFLGLIFIVYAIIAFNETTPFPSFYALLPTVGTALIILFGTSQTFTGRILSNRLLVGIGLVSYSAYLWHHPLFAFARIRSISEPSSELMLALGFLTLPMAYLSWKYVEKPFRNRQAYDRKFVFASSLTGMAAVICVGILVILSNGFDNRLSSSQRAAVAQVDKLYKERKVRVRSDTCHYNNFSEQGIDHFLLQWDCWDNDEESIGLQRTPVVVVGDSFSADVAASLRSNGYLVLQLGGADCSLDPNLMLERCARIFSTLAERLKKYEYFEYLIMANQYTRGELSLKSARSMVDYWDNFGLKLVWMSGAPEFYNLERLVISQDHGEPQYDLAEYSTRAELVTYLENRNVRVIDRMNPFCSLTSNCSYMDENKELLVVDGGHLSALGAKRFGAALLQHPILSNSILGAPEKKTANKDQRHDY